MIFYRYTIITQNINLFGNFLTTQQPSLDFVHLANPFAVNTFGYIFLKFRIFQIFRIRINRIYCRITFSIGTFLFQSIKTTGYLLGIFSYRFLQVTTCRRYGTDKSNGTGFTIIQMYISCTSVKVGNDGRDIHRECVRTR